MPDDARKPAAIIGVGNTLFGDDGFGPRVIEALRAGPAPEGADLVEGAAFGVELLEYLKDYRKVIIVDAAIMGLAPGTVRVFRPEEVRSMERGAGLSLHSTDILGVIELGKALGEELADVYVVAVEPEVLEIKEGLSESARNAIAKAVDDVRRLVG